MFLTLEYYHVGCELMHLYEGCATFLVIRFMLEKRNLLSV